VAAGVVDDDLEGRAVREQALDRGCCGGVVGDVEGDGPGGAAGVADLRGERLARAALAWAWTTTSRPSAARRRLIQRPSGCCRR
jgi:hypothetical protein